LVEQSVAQHGQELRLSKGSVYVLSQGVWREAVRLPEFVQMALINDFKNVARLRTEGARVSERDTRTPMRTDEMFLDVTIQQTIDGFEEVHVRLRQPS